MKCVHFESKPLVTHERYIDIRAAVTEWCTWVQAKEPTLKLQVVWVTESLSVVENPTEFMRIWRKMCHETAEQKLDCFDIVRNQQVEYI